MRRRRSSLLPLLAHREEEEGVRAGIEVEKVCGVCGGRRGAILQEEGEGTGEINKIDR